VVVVVAAAAVFAQGDNGDDAVSVVRDLDLDLLFYLFVDVL
jgi:hypothetical protein